MNVKQLKDMLATAPPEFDVVLEGGGDPIAVTTLTEDRLVVVEVNPLEDEGPEEGDDE